MVDRRISYSSGNFSSIERGDAGLPEAGPEPDRTGTPDRSADLRDAGPGTTAGTIGRTGRRRARIRDVADLGAVLAAARMTPEERRPVVPTASESPDADRGAPAANPQIPATEEGRGAPPKAAQGDPAASVVAAALDGAISGGDGPGSGPGSARDAAGTGRDLPPPEEASPPVVAELDEPSGKQLDLAEFVIQAAVSGDDDGAVQIPWMPEPADRAGNGAMTARGGRSGVPDTGAGQAPKSGEAARAGPDAARYGSGALDAGGGGIDGNDFPARRDMDNRNAGPARGPGPSGNGPPDYSNVGPDLSIPIAGEEEIPLVRAHYEEETAAWETGPAASGIAGSGAPDATAAAAGAESFPASEPAAPDDATPKFLRSRERSGFRPGRSPLVHSKRSAPDRDVPATGVSVPAADRDRKVAPGAPETDRTAPEEPSGAAARRTRKARKTVKGVAAGNDGALRGWKRLAARPESVEADRRANILSGLGIAAALGAVAWYVATPGPPSTRIVDAGKTDIAAPEGGKKAGAKTPGSTAGAGELRKPLIYRPAKKIELAAASAVGDLEYRISPNTVDRMVVSARGDNFGKMLQRAGVGAEEAARAVRALRKIYNPRRLPIGLELKVIFEAPGVGKPRFLGYRFDSSSDRMVHVSRLATGGFTARKVEKIVTHVYSRADGQIETSLFGAGVKAGVPPRIMLQMVRLFSFAVDFQRDLHGGEKFQVMYRSQKDESGRIVRHSDIVYTSLTVGGKARKLYVYEPPKGAVQYLNERGQGNRRTLMKTPIDGARLTSRFGYRKHPLLGFTKLHAGVDFGARPGTPIYAAGNGTIVKIGWFGAYGRYIRIRHGSVYQTAYAHMSRFQRGLRVGSRVKQGDTIGYVGNSGRSTGPHLHYEVIRNGRQVNPMKIALPARKNLKGRALKRFLAHRKEVDARYAALGLANERLQEGKVQTVGSKGAAGCKTGAGAVGQGDRACN